MPQPADAAAVSRTKRHPNGERAECDAYVLLLSDTRAGGLLMTDPVIVQIVGAPIACAQEVQDRWRDVAAWAAVQLRVR